MKYSVPSAGLLVVSLPFIVVLPLLLEWLDVIAPDSYKTGIASLIDGGRVAIGHDAAADAKLRARPVGSLYELVGQSKQLWDTRSTVDKLKLSSTRIVPILSSNSLFSTSTGRREHILVTGGFGSLGKHVVRDLLLLGRDQGTGEDEWAETSPDERRRRDADVIVTLLDISDKRDELDFLLRHLPQFHRARVLGAAGETASKTVGFDFVDPRSAAFAGQELSVESFVEEGRLRVARADVRNLTAMQQVLKPEQYGEFAYTSTKKRLANHRVSHAHDQDMPPISGVIHLAGYGSSICTLNPGDCRFVESEGARVMASVFAEIQSPARPWLVSADGPDASLLHDEARPPDSTAESVTEADQADYQQRPGRRKRQSETNQMHLTLESLASNSLLHSIALRLPPDTHVVGDPFASRRLPLPYLVHNALGHLPIHVNADSFPSFSKVRSDDDWAGLSIMSNEDVVEAILAASELLARASQVDFMSRVSVLVSTDIVPPIAEPAAVHDVVDFVLQLARSESPVSYQTLDGYRPATHPSLLSPRRASHLLGLKRPESPTVFLRSYLASMLSLQGKFLEQNVTQLCAPPPALNDLEKAILNADGCFVQLVTILDGMTWSLACSQDLDEYAQPLAVLNAVPHVEGVRGVRLKAERRPDGGVGAQVSLSCPTGPAGTDEPVAWLETDTESEASGRFVTLSDTPEATQQHFIIDFVRRDTKAFTLSLPLEGDGKPKRKLTVKDVGGIDAKMAYFPKTGAAPAQGEAILEFRLNEVCCADAVSRAGHNFLREDPLYTSQIAFPSTDGSTNVADSTFPIQRCRNYRQALEYMRKTRTWLDSSRSAQICPRMHGEGADWVAHDLPLCNVDCDAPISCLVTERCRCPQDRCPPYGNAGLGPFPDVAFSTQLSWGNDQTAAEETLQQKILNLPWSAVVLPHAWRTFSLEIDAFPRPHVVEIPQNIDNHLTKTECYELETAPVPFSSDHVIIEALRERNNPANISDFIVVPYYHGCYFNYVAENTYKKLADTVSFAETQITLSDTIFASNIVIPFTHDWGSCTGWWPRHEEVLSRNPPPPMSKATAWQVNGDYSTHCIKSERDVVIPSRSRNTPALVSSYGDVNVVTPALQRKHLAFFAGGMRGFGAFARTRLGCGRTFGDPEADFLYQSYAVNSNYIDTLNQAKFCILPRGIPAWSTRTFEAIYAGCIPVFVADRNHFPFEDILDYSRFSLSVPENEIDTIDAVMRSISEADLTRMQIAVLKVRDAFIYDENRGAEWTRRGPVLHTLISMTMRLTLMWPITDAC